MPTKLRKIGTNRTLDARPDRLDAYVKAGLILDQGKEGACTGFGLAAVINFQLFVSRPSRRSAAYGNF